LPSLIKLSTEVTISIEEAARLLQPQVGKLSSSAYYAPLVAAIQGSAVPTTFSSSVSTSAGSSHSNLSSILEKCKAPSDSDKLPEPNLAFRRAVAAGLVDIIALYQNVQGLDVNQQGSDTRRTAWHLAIINQRENVIPLLFSMGAKRNIRDKHDKYPIDYANTETIRRLFGSNL
jgi:hypothetical protein